MQTIKPALAPPVKPLTQAIRSCHTLYMTTTTSEISALIELIDTDLDNEYVDRQLTLETVRDRLARLLNKVHADEAK